jgi:hypothetical protein
MQIDGPLLGVCLLSAEPDRQQWSDLHPLGVTGATLHASGPRRALPVRALGLEFLASAGVLLHLLRR